MRFLALYLLALLAGILTAGYAASEPRHGTQPGYEVWFSEDTEVEGVLGKITHYNQDTYSGTDNMIVLETPAGIITLYINRTPNIDCLPEKPCPDTREVYDLPAGYVAVPSHHTIDEGTFGHMTIIKYSGM